MANIQIQRPQTVTTTEIAQKQSLEVVQTIIHGGLSTLSYLRELFPEKAYGDHIYGEGNDIPTYESYAAGALPVWDDTIAHANGTRMQVLQRGKSRRVDAFLSWLENDAFPAIQSGQLRALHVYVHTDPNERSKAVESYRFTVKYNRDATDGFIPAGIVVAASDTSAEAITVGDTSRSLQGLVRQIMDLCENLPRLPAKRYVSMALLYDQEHRIPQGWAASTMEGISLGEAEGWNRHNDTLDEVFSTFHETTFEISYLQESARIGTLTQDQSTIPNHLEYTRDCRNVHKKHRPSAKQASPPTEDDIERISTTEGLSKQPTIVPDIGESMATQIMPSQANGLSRPQSAWDALLPSRRTSALSATLNPNNTQSSKVAEMKAAFSGMMQPEQLTQGDTQTQGSLFRPPAASETTASPSHHMQSPSTVGADPAVAYDAQLRLSQTTVERLERGKAKKSTRAKTKSKRSRRKSLDVISCQCGHLQEEGDMVNCTICDTWQHLHCYGFTSDTDPRLPKEHVCYRCLLAEDEPNTLDKLHDLAQKRRVVHYALQTEPKKLGDIASALQLRLTTTETIVNDLQAQGYIVSAGGSKRASSSRLAWTVVKKESKHEKMLRELFDPLRLISHHYQMPLPTNEPTLDRRVSELSTIEMPPPMTPASRLLQSVQPPVSGLDPFEATISETPSKARLCAPNGAKRRHATAAAAEDETPRAKRVQTQFLLDAGGLSSSPAPSAHG